MPTIPEQEVGVGRMQRLKSVHCGWWWKWLGRYRKRVCKIKNNLKFFLEKLKIELPCNPAIVLQGLHPKKMAAGIQTDTNAPLFTEVLFTAARGQNNPNVHRQMNRSRNFVMHFRKGESLSLAAAWMNPEDIMLSKIKQTQRVKHYMIWFHF